MGYHWDEVFDLVESSWNTYHPWDIYQQCDIFQHHRTYWDISSPICGTFIQSFTPNVTEKCRLKKDQHHGSLKGWTYQSWEE